MEVGILDSWNHILESHFKNRSDVFFTEEYCKTFENAANDSRCEAFFYKNDNFVFLLPYLKTRIPGTQYFDFETIYGYSGPLFTSQDDLEINNAWKSFKELGESQNLVAGLIRFNPFRENAFPAKNIQLVYDRNIVSIDLTQTEDELIFKSVHHKHRNAINKTRRTNAQFVHDENFVYYKKFQELYDATMERLGAGEFYFFDNSFFELLKARLKGDLLLFGVISDGELVSACLVLKCGELAHYYLSASDERFWNLSPNTFMVFETAIALKKLGLKDFNLGGGYKNNDDSLFKFKERFSNKTLPFYIGKIVLNDLIYSQLVESWVLKADDERKEKFKNYLMKYRY